MATRAYLARDFVSSCFPSALSVLRGMNDARYLKKNDVKQYVPIPLMALPISDLRADWFIFCHGHLHSLKCIDLQLLDHCAAAGRPGFF